MEGSPDADKVPEVHLVEIQGGPSHHNGEQINTRAQVFHGMADYQMNILDDLSTWQRWAVQDCLRAGKLEHLRRHLEFDKRRMLNRMECLDKDKIMVDIAAIWPVEMSHTVLEIET